MSTPQVTHIEAALSDDQIKTILDVMPRIKSNKGIFYIRIPDTYDFFAV